MQIRDRVKELRKVPARELKANPRNWRKHPKAQADAMREMLADVGFAGAMLARETPDGLELIDGHLRTDLSADSIVPVLVLDVTEAEANKILATFDPISAMADADGAKLAELMEGMDIGDGAIAEMMKGVQDAIPEPEREVSEDEAPEPLPDPVSKTGDLWLLGEHRLLCGDSTKPEHAAIVCDNKGVDCIMTDPPYCSGGFQEAGKSAGSVGTDAEHVPIANDRLSTRGFAALLKSAFGNVQASFIYAFTDWRMWVHLFDIAESSGFCVRSMIVWDKGTPGMGRGWRCQHELILWGCKTTAPFDKHASGQGNVLACKRSGNENHTTEKPVTLMASLLTTTPFVVTVYDPFSGSGTTIIAAEQLSRKCYAIEIEPRYVDVAIRRWQKLTGREAILDGTKKTWAKVAKERGVTIPSA